MFKIERGDHSSLPDLMAFIALGGIVVSLGIWAAFSVVDSALSGVTLGQAFVLPISEQVIVRLSAIVVVLLATLVVQLIATSSIRASRRLARAQARVQEMYDRSPDGILSIDSNYRVLYANAQTEEFVGKPASEFVGTACHEGIFGCTDPCEDCPVKEVFATAAVHERTVEEDIGGTSRWLEQVFYPVLDGDGKVESVVESTRDATQAHDARDSLTKFNNELEVLITARTSDLLAAHAALAGEVVQRELTTDALNESELRYKQLIESSPDMVLVHRGGRIAFLNTPGAELMGFASPAEALGLPVAILIEPDGGGQTPGELIHAVETGSLKAPTHVKLKRATGEFIDVELSVGKLIYEGEDAVQCIIRDISDRVRAQATIQRMAYYDSLTELPNRTLFRDRLSSALAQARRREETVGVIFVDLDDFKAINDSYGHSVGDSVLKIAAQRLRTLLRDEDTVARQSGDEFTIIARLADREAAAGLAERIRDGIAGPIDVEGRRLHVSASIGVATYPFDGNCEADLLRHADTAMYVAKEWGHGHYRLYEPDMSESATSRLELEAGLRQALERREFELYYQPQIDVRDGHFVGVEALLRWNHPTRGVLTPKDFIELAEQAGFIGDIGEWVLDTACRQAALWLADGLKFGRIAVNLSAKEFVQRDIVENVALALENTGLDPGRLELEITESTAMYNVDVIFVILRALREMGVRVAIDDFGTGYSSMSYLKRFPIQTLKIARDFMRDVDVDQQSAAIATMLIELCRELGLDVVAEGVETVSQLNFLRERECFIVQGYLFSHPVTSGGLGDLLRNGLGDFVDGLPVVSSERATGE